MIVCVFRYIVPGKNELELGRVRTSQGFDNPVYDTPYDDNFVVSFDPSQDEVICLVCVLIMFLFSRMLTGNEYLFSQVFVTYLVMVIFKKTSLLFVKNDKQSDFVREISILFRRAV